MDTTSREDQIWNRACLQGGGPQPAEGDQALASLLRVHGRVMNGGVLHALEIQQESLRRAITAYRYFGLLDAAAVLEREWEDSDEAEEASNSAYWLAVPNDEIIAEAFRAKLASCPQAFSALSQA
jgi:hypothetical protein